MLRRWAGRAVTGPVGFFVSGLIDLGVLAQYLWRTRVERRSRSAGRLLVLIIVFSLAVAGLLGSARVGVAQASSTEPSILMDDYAFIYSSPAQVEHNLQQVAQLGVNVVKVSMVWSLIAPDSDATTRPAFDATDPSAYPAANWSRYDTLVEDAAQLGLKVYFQLTAPAPLWATNDDVSGHQYPWSHEPDAAEFGQFAQAVGARYSGTYEVPVTSSGSGNGEARSVLGTLARPARPGSDDDSGEVTLPAVRMWGIWNEPNEIGWLSPQTVTVDGHDVPRAPALERGLIDAGYRALVQTGHQDDTILIGETASRGAIRTLPFLKALYCVNGLDRPLTGAAASREDCPTSGNTQQFVVDNPGLFASSGWAHHPYSFNQAPSKPVTTSVGDVTLANLGVLERGLDAVQAAYGEPGGMPIYVTEFGYKSDPPNPFVKTNLTQQETWLDEGWYMSYFMPRVKSMAQELLYDQPPVSGKAKNSAAAWANFDSGLEFENGAAKPALAAFRIPIWLPSQRHGAHVTVWAEIRPAVKAANRTGALEFKAGGSGKWTVLAQAKTTNPEGFVLTHVDIPGPGQLRLAWGDPVTNAIYLSRTVTIS